MFLKKRFLVTEEHDYVELVLKSVLRSVRTASKINNFLSVSAYKKCTASVKHNFSALLPHKV
jgi:hypothetical protein